MIRTSRFTEGTSADGKLTQEQRDWLLFVAANNGIAIVLRPIASDPVGLRERIVRLLEREQCPTCYKQSKL